VAGVGGDSGARDGGELPGHWVGEGRGVGGATPH